MRRSTVLFVLMVLLASIPAGLAGRQEKETTGAPKHPIDVWLEECTAKDESTAGQIDCLATAFQKWDVELNRVYQALKDKLPETARPALKTAQLAWLNHRDAEFKLLDALYDALDGSMYRLMKAADRVDIVRKRALELSSYLDVLENV